MLMPQRGEVWLWDCGLVEKTRPVLILSVPFGDEDRAVVTVVFHSTALRGSLFEVVVPCAFFKPGAIVCQRIATYPIARAIRKLESTLLRRAELPKAVLNESILNATIGCKPFRRDPHAL